MEKFDFENEEWLRNEYLNKNKTIKSIADSFGVIPMRVSYYIKKFKINTRRKEHLQSINFTYKNKEWLSHKYCNEFLTIHEIATICNVSDTIICNNINKFEIKRSESYLEYLKRNNWYTVDEEGCWISNYAVKDKDGYAIVTINGKTKRLHRVVYENVYGEIGYQKLIRHKCNNPSCINPDHLIEGTCKENSEDMVRANRQYKPAGSKNTSAKLTEDIVYAIKFIETDNQPTIAKKYNVGQDVISRIRNNKAWKHVTKDYFKNKN